MLHQEILNFAGLQPLVLELGVRTTVPGNHLVTVQLVRQVPQLGRHRNHPPKPIVTDHHATSLPPSHHLK